MRIRLLLDVDISSSEIQELQEATDVQPVGTVQIDGLGILGVRLIGALPVPEAE